MIPPRSFGPLAGPPAKRVTVLDGERFAMRVTVDRDVADRAARQRIQEGLLRPADSHVAEIESVRLAWIPLWRVEVEVDGMHLGLRALRDGRGATRGVLPTGGEVHAGDVGVVLARRLLPVDPSVGLKIEAHDLVPYAHAPRDEGEWIEADVAKDEAEHEVARALRKRVIPSKALYANLEVRVKSAALVHLPVWLRRYRYAGEAAGTRVEECHVAIHAGTGEVVSERHPAAWRSLAGRLRRVFRRG